MKQNNIRKILEKNPLIPVVTFQTMEEIDSIVNKLIEKNITCIEITLRTEIAFQAIKYIKEKYGTTIDVGVGTIINKEQISKAKDLNVDFFVSPGINASLFQAFEDSKIAFIPGVITPSEIIQGLAQGYDTFKFFPAQLFGGVQTLSTYAQVFPQVKFCPTGGITESNYTSYSSLENVISVGGSWMIK